MRLCWKNLFSVVSLNKSSAVDSLSKDFFRSGSVLFFKLNSSVEDWQTAHCL
jgi:hypothetical protein